MTSKNKSRKMRRTTAVGLLGAVKRRIAYLNADPRFCYTVKRAVVFGSFINRPDEDYISDLDIALEFQQRYDRHSRQFEEARERYKGRDDLLYLDWPYQEVLKYLRGNSDYISIHRIGRDPEQDAIIFSDRYEEIDVEALKVYTEQTEADE